MFAPARRLAGRAARIDGITVHPNEMRTANALALSNYRAHLVNKHSRRVADLPGPYDFIVDNNLASFVCCRRHFRRMLENYVALLRRGGRILTDRRGMEWTVDGNDEWKLSFAHLTALAKQFPVRVERVAESVYALVKSSSHPSRARSAAG
jgi:hypothetical protein